MTEHVLFLRRTNSVAIGALRTSRKTKALLDAGRLTRRRLPQSIGVTV